MKPVFKTENWSRNVKWLNQRKCNTEFRNSGLPLQYLNHQIDPSGTIKSSHGDDADNSISGCCWCGSNETCSLACYETISSSGPSVLPLQGKQSQPTGTWYSSAKLLQSSLAIAQGCYLVVAFPPRPVTWMYICLAYLQSIL